MSSTGPALVNVCYLLTGSRYLENFSHSWHMDSTVCLSPMRGSSIHGSFVEGHFESSKASTPCNNLATTNKLFLYQIVRELEK